MNDTPENTNEAPQRRVPRFDPLPPKSFEPKHEGGRRTATYPAPRQQLDDMIKSQGPPIEPAPQPAPAVPTTPQAAASRADHTLDLITAHVLENITKLRAEFDSLEKMILQDAARIKAQLGGHVELGRLASAETTRISAFLQEMRDEYQRIANASVA